MTRFCLDRVRVLARFVQDQPSFTRPELNAWLQLNQVAVCAKTVDRDLQFLRDCCGYELEFDFTVNRWRGRVPARRVI